MVSGNLHAVAALIEATIAWRAGAFSLGRDLALEAHRVWSSLGRRWALGAPRALALACGDGPVGDELHALAEDALVCPSPEVGLQVLALLAPLDARVAALAAPHIARLTVEVPHAHWHQRIDIFSVVAHDGAPCSARRAPAPEVSPTVRCTRVRANACLGPSAESNRTRSFVYERSGQTRFLDRSMTNNRTRSSS